MNERRIFLQGLFGFPVAVATVTEGSSKEVTIPNQLNTSLLVKHYVWVFSIADEDFIPVGVFNTKEEGENLLSHLREEEKQRNHNTDEPLPGAVLASTWKEFLSMATTQRLGAIAATIEKLGIKI